MALFNKAKMASLSPTTPSHFGQNKKQNPKVNPKKPKAMPGFMSMFGKK